MRSILYVASNVDDALNRIRDFVEGDGFIFSEEDVTYTVRFQEGRAEKIKTWASFWSRKDQLEDKYPRNFSVTIKGVIRPEGDVVVIDAELIEYHGRRPHRNEGTRALMDYFERLCRAFQK